MRLLTLLLEASLVVPFPWLNCRPKRRTAALRAQRTGAFGPNSRFRRRSSETPSDTRTDQASDAHDLGF